jgi:hypothetical protein
MSGRVLLDYTKMDHEERVRKAEQARLYAAVCRINRRPSVLKSLLLALLRS